MPTASLPIVIIACQVFQGMIEPLLPPDLIGQITFLDYGLHATPQKMTPILQAHLDQLQPPSLVVLGYGLCGNGLKGLQSGIHTLLIPRTDDCIAILLGSYQAYRREFEACAGTYYLSKGWLEAGSTPLKEYQTYLKKYGPETAAWLMDQQYQNYQRLALVASSAEELTAYRQRALDVARYCEQWGYRYEEILGSDAFLRELVAVAADLSRAGDDFLIINPGQTVSPELFARA